MLDPRLISATPVTFEQQMHYLAKHYRVVSLEKVLEAVVKETRLPNRSVLITFDDAYCDFKDYAWPILKRLRLPATIFVPTAYPNQPYRAFWWDRLHRAFSYTRLTELCLASIGCLSLRTYKERRNSLRRVQNHAKTLAHSEAMALVDAICLKLDNGRNTQKSVLSWEELRQLAKDGVTLGAHTQTHPILTKLPTEQVRREITGSQQDLKREIGAVFPVFSYPDGEHNADAIDILSEEGFVLAFTTVDGQNDMRTAQYLRLRRTGITRRTSPTIFRLRLLRPVSYLDVWRHRKKQRRETD